MNNIRIQLDYLCDRNTEWKTVRMTPDRYFDLSENEPIDIDSVPLHAELLDYIPDSETVSKITLSIRNIRKHTELRLNASFWNHQRCRIIRRREFRKNKEIYNEFIYEASLPDIGGNPAKYDICRFTVEGNSIDCVYNGIITVNDNGSESENRII
ncbi:MAG: hypothetical protein ACI3XR_05880 [Eubacteriales bacterium]